jgi:ankyrin repeat protein
VRPVRGKGSSRLQGSRSDDIDLSLPGNADIGRQERGTMTRSLPARPDLGHLKKQAKALVRAGTANKLADAQRAIAREYGFSSWSHLKQHVESLTSTPVDALVNAVKANDVAAVERLLQRHDDLRGLLNDPLPGLSFGATLLTPAVQASSRELVEVLLRHGADIHAKSHWWAGGFGMLDVCAQEFAPFLIERGAVLTAYSAARLGRFDELKELVEEDATVVHQRGGDGQTPLHVAATAEIARFLIDHGAELDALDVDHESTPLQYAIRDRRDVARFLADRGARLDILSASALGDVDRVREILEANPEAIRTSVNRESFPMEHPKAGGTIYIWTLGANRTAHSIANEFGNEDVLEVLKQHTPPSLALALACELEDVAAIDRLTTEGPGLSSRLTEQERARIVFAADGNRTRTVRLMLQVGWPANVGRGDRVTALHFAAWHGNVAMVRDLLGHGASVDVEDAEHHASPLHWALHGSQNSWQRASGDYATTIDVLLAAGATPPDIDEVDASDAVVDALVDALARHRGGRASSHGH